MKKRLMLCALLLVVLLSGCAADPLQSQTVGRAGKRTHGIERAGIGRSQAATRASGEAGGNRKPHRGTIRSCDKRAGTDSEARARI